MMMRLSMLVMAPGVTLSASTLSGGPTRKIGKQLILAPPMNNAKTAAEKNFNKWLVCEEEKEALKEKLELKPALVAAETVEAEEAIMEECMTDALRDIGCMEECMTDALRKCYGSRKLMTLKKQDKVERNLLKEVVTP